MNSFHPILELTYLKTAALRAFFYEGERLSAKVLRVISKDRALVRIKGIDIELRTQIPLQNNQRLTLRVNAIGKGYLRFEAIGGMASGSKIVSLRELRKDRGVFWYRVHQELLDPLQKEFPLMLHPSKGTAENLKEIITFLHPKNGKIDSWLTMELGDTKAQEFMMLLQLLWLSGSMTESFTTILPLDWEEVEQSSIVFKKIKSSNAYYCRVSLRFDSWDRVAATFILHRHYLNLYLAIEDEEFRAKVESQAHQLKQILSGGKVAVNLFIKEYNENDESYLVGEHFIKRQV